MLINAKELFECLSATINTSLKLAADIGPLFPPIFNTFEVMCGFRRLSPASGQGIGFVNNSF